MKSSISFHCFKRLCPCDKPIIAYNTVKRFVIESSTLFYIVVYLFKIIITCNYRYYNPFSFFKTASCNMITARGIPLQRKITVREDLFIMDASEEKKELYKGDVGRRILFKFLGTQAVQGSSEDKTLMERFLEKSSENKLPKVTDLEMLKFLPGGAPLVSYLEVDNATSQDGYQFPTQLYLEDLANRRSLDTETVSGVEIREITLGKSHELEVTYQLKWALDKIKDDKLKYPANFCSFDMKMVPFPINRYRELMKRGRNWEKNPEPMVVPVQDNDLDTTDIPTRILVGNGVTWILSIRFNHDLIENERGQAQLSLSLNPLPDAFMNFFSSLHLLVGHHTITLRNGLQEYLSEVYGVERELPPVMQIDALSTAAGWKLPATDRFSTNLATLGGLLYRGGEMMWSGPRWAADWSKLPTEFKSYCIGNLRSDYSSYIVLISLLMRNTFPDIEMLCSTLELTQTQAIEWFTWLVSVCVGESVPEPGARLQAKTRQDLILSLRKYDYSSEPKKLYKEPEDTAILLSKLIPDWPTVVHGGPRFLHSVLPFFVEQIQILQTLHKAHPYLAPHIKREIDDKFIKRCTYNRGMEREDVYEGTEDFGLGCKPELAEKIYKIDLAKLTDKDITAMADQTGQAKVLGILESVRLSIDTCTPLLRKLRTLDLDSVDYSFWLEKTSLYERLRLMHLFLLDKPTVAVERLEEEVHTRQQNVLQQEEETRARDEKIVEKRKKREDLYQANQIYAQGGTRNRTGLQQQIYGQVPGDHKQRNKKWRESKKKMYQKVKRLNNYIPRKEWKALGKKGERPARANPYNVRTEGLDLRQVLVNKHEKSVTQAAQTIEYQGRLINSENDPNSSQAEFTADPERRVYLTQPPPDVSEQGYYSPEPRFVSKIVTPGQYSPRGTPPRRYRSPTPRFSYQPRSPSSRYSYQPRSPSPRYSYQQRYERRSPSTKRERSPSPGCSYQPRHPSPKRYRTPSPAVGERHRYRSQTPECIYQTRESKEICEDERDPDGSHSQRNLYKEEKGKGKGKGKSSRQVTVFQTARTEGYWSKGYRITQDYRNPDESYPKRN